MTSRITIKEAVAEGLSGPSVDAVRQALHRDPAAPQPVSRRANADEYDRAQWCGWEESRRQPRKLAPMTDSDSHAVPDEVIRASLTARELELNHVMGRGEGKSPVAVAVAVAVDRIAAQEWKSWPGFSLYEASHRGAIRNRRTGRVLAVTIINGYERLNLYADDGTRPNLSVARVVLTAHDRPPEPGEESCHGLGGSRDNRWPENIRWDDKAGNEHDKIAAGTTPTPNPTYPCKDTCGALVINEGRRCADCVKRVGREAAAMLGRGVNLYDVAEHFGYTQPDWVFKLATEHGGCTLTKRDALAQQPSMSQRVTGGLVTRLATLRARRGWRSDAGDTR